MNIQQTKLKHNNTIKNNNKQDKNKNNQEIARTRYNKQSKTININKHKTNR